jgi:PKD repeat protein
MIRGQHRKNNCQLRIFVWTIAIILFGAGVHATEFKVNPSTSFFVPVHLETQQAIYSCDIRIQFDNTRLKAIGATLQGTILEGRGYQLVQNVGLTGEARFPVYSSGNLYTGNGIVLYIEFEPLVSPGEESMLQLSRFRCNESDVQGGLWVQDSYSSEISIMVNNLPEAFDQTKEIMEDEQVVITLTAYDVNTSDTFSYTLDTAPTLGTAVLSETTGRLTYTPNPDIFGTEHFTYVVSDGIGLSSPGHITIIIRSGNDLPLGTPVTVETAEDMSKDFTLLAVDSDNDPITYALNVLPSKGTLTLLDTVSGACRYTPETNDSGTYYFTFIASDPYGDSEPASMTIIITPVNDAPVATGAAYTLNEDEPFETQLMGSDIDSGSLTYEILESSPEISVKILDAQRGKINIIPEENKNGEYQFTFQVSDGLEDSEPAIVLITVLPQNDPPVATPGTIHLDEDTPRIFQISGVDIEDDPLSYAIHMEPDRGTLSLNGQSGECSYTPPADESGQVTFMFTTLDEHLTSEPAMFTLIIDPVNDSPVPQNDTIETPEDTSIEITLKATDIDSAIEAFSILEFPDGNLELIDPSTGLCQYTPITNAFGPDIFSFTASDAESTSEPGFITINITPVNDPPVAVSMSITANEDQVRTITLDASDPDYDPITFTLLTQPDHGNIFNYVYENEIMTVQYKPVTDYYGSDQFTYELFDGEYKSSIAVIDIEVLYVNDPPFVQSDIISVAEDESVTYTLKAYDEDSQITGFKINEEPRHGQVIMTNALKGLIIYTPNQDYFGSDAFSYQCMDDESESEPAVISITVEPVNDLPVGYAKTFLLDEDIPLTGNLSFDDPDYDMLTITVYTEPEHGTLTITDRRTGAFLYYPEENFSGDDYILFEACDDVACSGPVTMTFTIRPVNDPPVAFPQSLTLNEDQPINITLAAYDVENLLEEYEIAEHPGEGLLEIIDATAGLFQYIPEQDTYGTYFFLFQVRDESQNSAPAMVTMTILPVNDPPVATASAYTLLEDNSFDGTLEAFDADGDDLTLTIFPPPEHGWISSFDPKSGDFSYLPLSNYNGEDYFSYTVCDQQICSVKKTITLTIQPDNDIPVVSSASFELEEDTVLSLTLTARDVDNDALTFEITQPSKGNLVLLDSQSGACIYTPLAEDSGETQFTYRVFDGFEYSDEAEIQLTIIPVNDEPIAFPGDAEIEEDQTYTGKVMAEDVDNVNLTYFIYQKPMKGNLLISESGQGNFVYSPYSNENGQDIFWFYVYDGEVNSQPQPFTINITPINDPPQAEDFMAIVNAGEVIECVLNASDPDVDPITYTIVKEPEKGSVQFFDQKTGKVEYFADENSSGEDTITFRVSDGILTSEDANIIISINPLGNYQPVANPMALTVTEGISSYFTLDASDTDDNPLIYHIFQEPTKGAFTFDAHTGESIYESYLNAQGFDNIVYYVNDGMVNSDPAKITLAIQPMPEAVVPKQDILNIPVVINEEKTIESINIQVKFEPNEMEVLDMSLDNTILTSGDYGFSTQIGTNGIAVFPISSQGSSIRGKGVVAYLRFKILGNEGDIVYLEMPKLTCNESRIFGGFEIDGAISSKIRLIINEIPIAYDGNIVMDEEQILNYPLVGYDQNIDDPVSFTILSYPEKVTLTLVNAQTGQCILSANLNEYGSDFFVYQSFDGKDYSKPANMSIQINPINDRPVAYPISLTVLEDMPTSITLLGEDPADPEDTLIFRIVQKPANGVGILLYPFEGIYVYENNINHYGMDSFTYVVDDFIEKSEPVTVNINVIPVNDAPIPKSMTYTTQEDTMYTFDLEAEDPENDIFEYILLESTTMGTLDFNSVNGHCIYQPNATISGTDAFIIQAKDSNGAISEPTTIYIVITPENDAPVVTSVSSFEIMEDTTLTETLTAIDQDQDDLIFIVKSPPEKGTVELNPSGEFTYTPFKDQTGQDIFIVAAKDPYIESESVPITVSVLPVNDPPTFEKGIDINLLEDAGEQKVSNWANNISAGADNESDQILSFHLTPDNAALFAQQPQIDSSGTLTFVPNNDVFGETLVSVFVQDDGGTSNGGNNSSETFQFTIRIESVNDAPSFTVGQKQSVEEDSDIINIPNWIAVYNPGPTNEAGQTLTFHLSTDNEAVFEQIPTVSSSGTLSFQPAPDYFGEAVVSIRLQDDGGTLNGGLDTSLTQTFVIEITPVNDPPVADAGTSYTITERLELELNGLGSSDIDSDTLTYLWTIPDIPGFEIQNETTAIATITAPYVETSSESFTVTLTVTDNENASAIDTALILVNNMTQPEAAFSATPVTGTAPLSVQFTDTSTGMPENWVWDFGDNASSFEQHPLHVYKKSGVYTISLTVTGPGGTNSRTQTDLIQVNASTQPLEIDFTVNQSEGFVPFDVQFTPEITGEVTQWQWDFGDGSVSNDFNATHTYSEIGAYTVTLHAQSQDESKTKTYENLILVKGLVLKGTVTNSDSDPLTNYRVEAYLIDTYAGGTQTDENGQYTITGLLPSTQYVVGVWPPENDTQYVYQYYNNVESLFDASYIEIARETTLDFTMSKAPRRWLTGQVTDGSNPIPYTQVDIYSDRQGLSKYATTDANGVYTITGLKEASDYRVSFYSDALETEFFYFSTQMSVKTISQAKQLLPTEEGLKDIDIIVNAIQGGKIEGDVTDGSGNAISNMRVNAWADSLNAGGSAITDDDGHYVIAGLTPSDTPAYVVEIQPNGYMYQVYNNNSKTPVATGSTDINFELQDKAMLSGTIKHTAGQYIAKARVQIYSQENPSGSSKETYSSDNGTYTFTDLQIRNDYILMVEADGYPVHYFENTTDLENATLLSLENGSKTDVEIDLDKGMVIKGRVHDQTFGVPIVSGTKVTLRSDSLGLLKTTPTDDTGYFEFSGLDATVSDYILSVIIDNYLPAYFRDNQNMSAEDDTVYNNAEAIAVQALAENDAKECHIILVQGMMLTGFVSHNDESVSGAIVKIYSDHGSWKTTTTNNTEINYTISGIQPDTYTVEITSNAYEKLSEQITIDNNMSQNFKLLVLPGRTIQGTVFNLEQDKQIQLFLQSLSKNVQKTITLVGTGGAYAYSFYDLLPASDYTLELKSLDYSNQYYDHVYQSDDASRIDVLNDDITGVDFTITLDLSEITGRIDFPATATNGDLVRIEVKSGSSGIEDFIEIEFSGTQEVAYRITGLLPSDYILQVRSDVYLNRYWNGTDVYGTKYVENALPVNTLSGSATANLTLNPGQRIEGTVKDLNGELLENIQVDVWSDKESVAVITHTSADGTYSVNGLDEADDYQIKATTATNAKFYYYNDTESVQIPDNATLVSTKTGNQYNMNIIISKGETISGKLRGVNGQAISGIWVNAWSETIGVGCGVFSSDDGSFEILDLPKAQDYKISAKPEWNQPYWSVEQNNIAAPSSAVDLVLPDKTGFTVTGTIKDEAGAPVKDATVEIQSASKPDQFGWNKTDTNGQYTIDLLPEGSDYALKVKPSQDSNLAYSEQVISISANYEKDVILETGYVFAGTIVAKDSQTNLADADIMVWSDTTHFIGEATTNINGEFSIGNVPNHSDYVVSVKADDYLELKRDGQSPKTGLVYSLEKSGLIQGTVRSLLTGALIPDASIEIYSQANQGLDVYNGVASTDQDGHYAVGGLKPVDEQGNGITDFVVTVYATGFPPVAKTGKQLGDTVSFDLTKGPENEISGNIENAGSRAVAIDVFEVTQISPTREDKFIKTVMANDDASFLIDGLRADGQFVFKFVTDDNHEQWAGENDKGVNLQIDAKVYQTQSEIKFQFTNLRKRRIISRNSGPGPVQGLKSLSHSYKVMNVRIRTAVKSTGPDKPSNDANVTVAWDPPAEGTSDLSGYYHFFDQDMNKEINKFTIDTKPPIRTRKITSRDLAGDDVNYYFHVASVDKEGRVGDTTSIAFRIDTTPPSNVNVTAPTLTDRQNIDLKLGATGANEMYISNIGYAEGGQWESRSIDRVWRLTDGDGSKNIYTRFRDKAGNEAKAAAITVYQPPLPVYTIRAEAWSNGDITPVGDVFVTQGEDITFTLTPDTDYLIDTLLLDDTPQSIAGNTYTLSNVQKPHHVVATFKQDNNAPVAYDKTIDLFEDTPKEFTLSAYDLDGDTLSYMADDPSQGNLQSLGGNRYSYAPENNDSGQYTFQFTVSDGDLTSNVATVTLNIIAENDPPEVVPMNVYPDINSAIAITLTANDVDSSNFSYTISVSPKNGQATIQGNIVTYTPNVGYQGKDTFTYQANDGIDDSEMAEVTLWVGVSEVDLILDEDVVTMITTINYDAQVIVPPEKGSIFKLNQNRIAFVPKQHANGEDFFTYTFASDPNTYTFTIFIKEINDAPWFTSASEYTSKEDEPLKITLNASDIENNPLTYGIHESPEIGQLTVNGAFLSYTPIDNFNGTVSMIAWVKDPYTTIYQNISIEIEPVNDAPVAQNYFDHAGLSNSISFTLTASDVDGDSLTYRIASQPGSGTLSGNGQQWTYTPDLKKTGHEEISFIANDGVADSNLGYIYLYFGMEVVHAYDDEDTPIDIREGLEKFHDITNDESIEITSEPESGQIQGNQYIPDTNFFGADQFEFKAQDKSGIFKIYVIAVDDPPVITGPGTIETLEDNSRDIIFTVEDVDSESLIYTLISNVSHGELSGTTTRYTYTPELNYNGSDYMALRVSDGNSMASASVVITIHPMNDPPVGISQKLNMYEDQTLSIQLDGVDPEDLPLTDFAIAVTPVHGTLTSYNSTTDWVYTPESNFNGLDSFTFTLSDGQLISEEATVSIQIRNVNDLPYANGRSITMTDSSSVSGYLYAYDHPLDHDTLIYSIQSNAKKGMVVINNPITGAFTYYPNNYATGVDYFTFKVNDGYADSNTATMIVYISSPVSDLLRLTINLQPPYDGREYHYLIRDVVQGVVVREDDANTREMEHQLAAGQYQIIIRSEGFALYASPEPIVLTTDKAIGIALTQGNSPPDITMPDISHKMISGGFLLKMIPNQDNDNPFELFIIDNTQRAVAFNPLTTENILTCQWLENPDAVNGLYTDIQPDDPSPDDTTYTIIVQVKYDSETIATYPITYIAYASSTNAEQNKPEDQKVFESTYGPSESVEFSNKLFYPLLGENLRIVVSDTQGQDIEIPIRIPSLPLSCLYIENTLIYDADSDYYDIATSSSQTLTPQTQLLAKIKHYTFGKDSLGSGVDISFEVAETGVPVRYNPVYNRNGQRADQVNNETAPDIEVPLLLNPESGSYTSFRDDLITSDTVELFYNEKGDGTNGFKLSKSAYTIDQKNKDLVKLSTNHLTGIGFAIQEEEEQAPVTCDDCDSSCFVGLLTGHCSFGFLWLVLLWGCIAAIKRRKACYL